MNAVEDNSKKSLRLIGYWMTERKTQKMKWLDFGKLCRNYGFLLVKLDLTKSLEEQGPFTVILHKMAELLGGSDEKSIAMVKRVETYIHDHPEVIVIDPLDNVRLILNRLHSYCAIPLADLEKYDIFAPNHVELTSTDVAENLQKLKAANVTFPFVCKPSAVYEINHTQRHTMAVIFNEQGLADCHPPCVAQSFINHNAVLFKVFVVGDEFQIVERPSLKNFQYSAYEPSIFFNSHDVSKPNSTSSLSVLDVEDASTEVPVINEDKVRAMVSILKQELGLALFGIDFVVTNDTGRYGIIDINLYPGYDGFPNFCECLIKYIAKTVNERDLNKRTPVSLNRSSSSSSSPRRFSYKSCENSDHSGTVSPLDSDVRFIHPNASHITGRSDQDDSGFDTSDSSDEKKYKNQQNHHASNLASNSQDQSLSSDDKKS